MSRHHGRERIKWQRMLLFKEKMRKEMQRRKKIVQETWKTIDRGCKRNSKWLEGN